MTVTTLFTCLICLVSLSSANLNLNQFDCSTLATEEAVIDGGMDMVQSFLNEFGKEAVFDAE